MELSIKLPVDNDGFIEYECPHCKKVFRLNKNLFADNEDCQELHCPYCGLISETKKFYTSECVEYINKRAEQVALEEIHKTFKDMERKTKNSLIRFKAGKPTAYEISELKLHYGIDRTVICEMCENLYKIAESYVVSYCPYCGEIK